MATHIHIWGAGPAGSSAALAALNVGATVQLIEKAKFPRHKVCGEFLSPEIQPLLGDLGVWDRFQAANPSRIRRMVLHFDRGSRGPLRRESTLPEPAWGLSRYVFDQILLDEAQKRGALLTGPEAATLADSDAATIVAHGRQVEQTKKGDRLFGFKAHFDGPVDDAVELFFFGGCYVGLNSVEGGKTNICGLASEGFLRNFSFLYDTVVEQSPVLRERTKPLSRSTPWFSTGPLEFRQRFKHGFDVGSTAHVPDVRWRKQAGAPESASYPAGDALSFVDPFTGSGLLAAVRTGTLAGHAAAQGESVADYLDRCQVSLRQPFLVAGVLRKIVSRGWAPTLAGWVPERLLFEWTRPQ